MKNEKFGVSFNYKAVFYIIIHILIPMPAPSSFVIRKFVIRRGLS